MRYLDLVKILFFPVLFPLSLIYSLIVLFDRLLFKKPYKSNGFVLSVGNVQVGGTGKSPVVLELVERLKEKKLSPVVISKSYKASLKQPKEVFVSDRAFEVGDEALMIKKATQDTPVFSGPSKVKVLKYAEKRLGLSERRVFIIDDGAQHHKLNKDLNVVVWDGSRSLFDIFSFPLGLSREFFLFSNKADFILLNRAEDNLLSKFLIKFYDSRLKSLKYKIDTIENSKHERLQKNASLISGVGNFNALKENVLEQLKSRGLKIKSIIRASDHDSFKKYKLDPEEFYICTEKDHDKLKGKVTDEQLYIVKSSFDSLSKIEILNIADFVNEKMVEI